MRSWAYWASGPSTTRTSTGCRGSANRYPSGNGSPGGHLTFIRSSIASPLLRNGTIADHSAHRGARNACGALPCAKEKTPGAQSAGRHWNLCRTARTETSSEAIDAGAGGTPRVLPNLLVLNLALTHDVGPVVLHAGPHLPGIGMMVSRSAQKSLPLLQPHPCGNAGYRTAQHASPQGYMRSGAGIASAARPFSMVVANARARTSLYASPSLPSTCSLA